MTHKKTPGRPEFSHAPWGSDAQRLVWGALKETWGGSSFP
ncbi:hypothetical protein THICB1_100556 [Thiomonas arsenitoxydans]|uniref:Uncharacterized protein n=1 Tax=Thiomonas arsenitoxydans (strain DSM 22701 / CIP 110005 / 3As) TaxID=426114 RepID=A0ABP1Z1Z8_THIA3|nr:hypothetical protein THICB1_100556 [Thiomonas arsenitoxydans]CQR32974.1 hypothetical protein THICB6_160354 [Thiomonas arsenitoxydans]